MSRQENKVATIGTNFNVTGQLVLTASYSRDKQRNVAASKCKVAVVGANYFLSKRTDIYAEIDRNELSGLHPRSEPLSLERSGVHIWARRHSLCRG